MKKIWRWFWVVTRIWAGLDVWAALMWWSGRGKIVRWHGGGPIKARKLTQQLHWRPWWTAGKFLVLFLFYFFILFSWLLFSFSSSHVTGFISGMLSSGFRERRMTSIFLTAPLFLPASWKVPPLKYITLWMIICTRWGITLQMAYTQSGIYLWRQFRIPRHQNSPITPNDKKAVGKMSSGALVECRYVVCCFLCASFSLVYCCLTFVLPFILMIQVQVPYYSHAM